MGRGIWLRHFRNAARSICERHRHRKYNSIQNWRTQSVFIFNMYDEREREAGKKDEKIWYNILSGGKRLKFDTRSNWKQVYDLKNVYLTFFSQTFYGKFDVMKYEYLDQDDNI